MAEESSSILIIDDELEDIVDDNNILPEVSFQTEWERDIKSHCDQIILNISRKEDDLKQKETEIEVSRALLSKEKEEIKIKLEADRGKFEEHYERSMNELEEKELQLDQRRKELEDEFEEKKQEFENEKKKMQSLYEIQEGKIKLDIGGHMFTTSKQTLGFDPNSMMALMVCGRHDMSKSDDGTYFIDRDGTHFRYILNYLRGGITVPSALPEDISILKELKREADFYQLTGLIELLDEALGNPFVKSDYTQEEITEMMSTLVRDDPASLAYVNASPMGTVSFLSSMETVSDDNSLGRARFVSQNMTKQDLNFRNKNLNGISFAHTTFFHHVTFQNASLTGASFYGCEFSVSVVVRFDYADLTDCDFRQCKGKEAGCRVSYTHGGGLVSASSSDTFLQLVQENRISFKKSKIDGALFDPKVLNFLKNEK